MFMIAFRLLMQLCVIGFCCGWFSNHANLPPPSGVSRRMDLTVGSLIVGSVFILLSIMIWSF